MPIELSCSQGHRWKVDDDVCTSTCPECAEPVTLPDTRTISHADSAVSSHWTGMPAEIGGTHPYRPADNPERQASIASPIPGYEILGEIGRGGMGVVYKARQINADRIVALKMIIAGAHAGEGALARFRTEAESVARMQHSSIVQVFDVGEHAGLPYFSLEFCPGGTLEQKLSGTPLQAPTAADLVEKLARATHAAHEKQIIHRDLKPANVLFDADGQAKLTDFGLAKKLDIDDGGTRTGAVMGTPSYMAPEQAAGDKAAVGPACDLYALGAILYECLTGRPPFRAATVMDTLMQVLHEEPASPRRLNPKVPRDLETICLKCLHKQPTRRYGNAAELADDLSRFQSGRPIRARPVGRLERSVKWLRRNPVETALASIIALALALGAVGIYAGYREAKRQQGFAEEKAGALTLALGERDQALETARHLLDVSQVQLAWSAFRDGLFGLAKQRLDAVRLQQRGWEWQFIQRQCQGGILTFVGHDGPVNGVAFSPDGKRVATASDDGSTRIWSARTGDPLLLMRGHDGPVRTVTFAPNGSLLATGGKDGIVRVWDALTGRMRFELKGHADEIGGVAFSPDDWRIASVAANGSIRIWDAKNGSSLLAFQGKNVWIASGISFSPDGTRLATDEEVWDSFTGKLLLKVERSSETERLESRGGWVTHYQDNVSGMSFGPTGQILANAANVKTARLCDATSGRLVAELKGHRQIIKSMSFSPEGLRLATASRDGTARIWTGFPNPVSTELRGHAGAVNCVAFSPDGQRLATASDDGTARLWDARTVAPALSREHRAPVFSVSFNNTGARLATAAGADWLHVETVATRATMLERQTSDAFVLPRIATAALHPNGSRVATATVDEIARIWDVSSGRLLLSLKGHTKRVWGVAYSPDGSRIATAADDNTARIWDAESGAALLKLAGHTSDVNRPVFNSDGTLLLTTSNDRTARLWDARSGKLLRNYEGHRDSVYDGSFSFDGQHIATASADGVARIWNAADGSLVLELSGHSGAVHGVCFSPDGKRLATAGFDRTIRIWDTHTGAPLLELTGHAGPVNAVAFSPDGGWLASASDDNTSRLWDGRPLDDAGERFHRLWHTRPDPGHFAVELARAEKSADRFATAFYVERLLEQRSANREELLRQRATVATNPLLRFRARVHSPGQFGLLLLHDGRLPFLAFQRDPLALRVLGGLLWRRGKPDEGIAPLKSALALREGDRPPVEELLLALVFADMKQPEEARRWLDKATLWLDRYKTPFQITSALGCAPSGPLFAATELVKQPLDPRYNPFDWETWHECDVFRDEVEKELGR